MRKIGIIGSIGVGKSTFLQRLSEEIENLEPESKVNIFGEPSIIHGNLNDILLNRFYMNTSRWAYPLQAGISASHEAIFVEINERIEKEKRKNYYLVDAPFSSYIYCRIHRDNNRMTQEEVETIDSIIRPGFEFDMLIVLKETPETTIDRIIKRSRGSEVRDFDYIYEHVEEYNKYLPGYIETYMSKTKIYEIDGIPPITSEDYSELVREVAMDITGVS